MELNYGMSLEQKQQLSQNQIQSLEVLAMDSVELSEFLQDEYLENPLLDYSEEHAMPGGREDIGQTYEQPPVLEQNYDDTAEEEDRRRKDIPMPETESIKNYILEQLPDGACSRKLAEFMTDCLDDNGFFTIPVEEVAQKTGVPEAEVSWTLKVLQELEPYGIFAPDLKHSLLKQLEMQGLKNAPVSQMVKEHLQDVADGKISAISRALKLSTAEVRKCIDQIAKLNPRPLGEFGGKRNDYVVPDIIFRKDDGKWEIELNDGWVEDYHINLSENDEGNHRRAAEVLFPEKTGANSFCDEQYRTETQDNSSDIGADSECTGAFSGWNRILKTHDDDGCGRKPWNSYFYGEPGHQRKVYPVSVRNHIDEASVYGIGFSSRRK